MSKAKILVVGSANTGLIVKVKKHPVPGETVLGEALETVSGGKGANQAVAVARLGGAVTFLACLGKDAYGENALKQYKKDKIDVSKIKRVKTASGVALITVSGAGENMITVAGGANLDLLPADIKKMANSFGLFSIALVQLETPLKTVAELAKHCLKKKLDLILNPAPAVKLPAKLLKQISYLTPNETELEILTGKKLKSSKSMATAARKLLQGRLKAVIVTLGKQGALIVEKKSGEHIRAPKVKVLDTKPQAIVLMGL